MGHHGNSFLSFGAEAAVGGWVELARTTLGSANATISVTGLADKRYYMILCDTPSISAAANTGSQLNTITTSTYANRGSNQGGTDFTGVSQTSIVAGGTGTVNYFQVGYWANLSAEEKLQQSWLVAGTSAGAGIVPFRNETVAKHAQTTNPISSYQWITTTAATFPTGAEVVVLGWDPADVHTTNFWEELASVDLSGGAADLIDSGTFTAKKYLWVQLYVSTITGAVSQRLTFNSDTGTNYAQRRSSDGGSDVTGGSKVNIDGFNDDLVVTSGGFTNMFIINNSATEKLGIVHSMSAEAAGAGNAPTRDEGVFKWANTAAQITKLTFTNNKAGSMGTETILKIWGSD